MMNRPLPMRSGRFIMTGVSRSLRKMGKRNPRIHRFRGNRRRDTSRTLHTRDIHTHHRRHRIRQIPRNLHIRGISRACRILRNRQRGLRIRRKVCPIGILRIGK